MIPHKCPVCNGNGMVPAGFYHQLRGYWSGTSITPEQCISCDGTGVVWEDVEPIITGGYFAFGKENVEALEAIMSRAKDIPPELAQVIEEDFFDLI